MSNGQWAGKRVARFAVPGLIVVAMIVVPFLVFGESIEDWAFEVMADPARRAQAAAVAALLLAGDILLPVPSSILGVALGALVGVVWGTLVGAAAMTVGSLVGLWLGRSLGAAPLKRWVGDEDYRWISGELAGRGLWVVVACRPVPVLAEASVIVAGAAGTPPARTLAALALANTGVSLVYAASGAVAMSEASLVLAFVAALVVPGAAWLIATLFRRR